MNHEERRLNIIVDPSTEVEKLNYEDAKILRKSLKEFTNETINKYYNEYKDFFVKEDIERMVKKCVDDYEFSEGLNIELATQFRMDSLVLKVLALRYKHLNKDSDEEAIELVAFIIDKLESTMMERYPGVPTKVIEDIIEDTFINYDGNKNFNVEVRKGIRKAM